MDERKHLRAANWPASAGELASAAEGNCAPGDLVEQLRNLGDEDFSGPDKAWPPSSVPEEPRAVKSFLRVQHGKESFPRKGGLSE